MIPILTNYKRIFSAPIDSTDVLNTEESLTTYMESPLCYDGQLIYVEESKKLYLIIDVNSIMTKYEISYGDAIYGSFVVSLSEYVTTTSIDKTIPANTVIDKIYYSGDSADLLIKFNLIDVTDNLLSGSFYIINEETTVQITYTGLTNEKLLLSFSPILNQ